MALEVGLQVVSGRSRTIPTPPRPKNNGDTDPTRYIPSGMSAADRAALREAALEWNDTLGGVMAHGHPTKYPAAQNQRHFRKGDGADRTYGASMVDDLMENLSPTFGDQAVAETITEKFVQAIADDLAGSSTPVKRYLARNDGSSVNAGSNWFGVTAEHGGSWYYTVGSFLIAYGAYATRSGNETTVYYRTFIYDRYNWDIRPDGSGKTTTLPSLVGWALDEDEIEGAADLELNPGEPYFTQTGEGGYILNDAVFGSLVESGDAANFDIVGSGTIQWRKIVDGDPETATPQMTKETGTSR